MNLRRFVDITLLGFLALVSGGALAQIVSSLPFTLQNNTLADATQVMANLNQIVSNINANSAKNGVNSDITVLAGLTTPLTAAQGGSQTYLATGVSGTANAIVVSAVVPTGFALGSGIKVRFQASASNTGPTTLNVAGTGVKNVNRFVSFALGGAELVANNYVEVIYDGSEYQLQNNQNNYPVGASITLRSALPVGFLYEDGSCISRSGFALLFATIGTTYGVCDGVTTFGLPDSRGRLDAGRDDQGVVGAAGRITNALSGCVATTLGIGCGFETHTLSLGETPTHNHASPAVTADAHSHTTVAYNASATTTLLAGGTGAVASAVTSSVASGFVTLAATTGNSGTGNAHTILNPLIVANKAIKY